MPIYEYKCSKCEKTFEFLQSINEPRKTQCPECKEETLEKQLTSSAFKISGGGVYSPGFSSGKK